MVLSVFSNETTDPSKQQTTKNKFANPKVWEVAKSYVLPLVLFCQPSNKQRTQKEKQETTKQKRKKHDRTQLSASTPPQGMQCFLFLGFCGWPKTRKQRKKHRTKKPGAKKQKHENNRQDPTLYGFPAVCNLSYMFWFLALFLASWVVYVVKRTGSATVRLQRANLGWL